jgi:hypothetical protein
VAAAAEKRTARRAATSADTSNNETTRWITEVELGGSKNPGPVGPTESAGARPTSWQLVTSEGVTSMGIWREGQVEKGCHKGRPYR